MYTFKLIVDGSAESLAASEFAVELARRTKRPLVGTTLVDATQILKFTGYQGIGLCGSGVFLNAHERIVQIICEINEALMESLVARAEGNNVKVEEKILYGEPIAVIGETAADGDFYILGGHSKNLNLARMIFQRTHCPVTVLVGRSDGKWALMLMADRSESIEKLVDVMRAFPVDVVWCNSEQPCTASVQGMAAWKVA